MICEPFELADGTDLDSIRVLEAPNEFLTAVAHGVGYMPDDVAAGQIRLVTLPVSLGRARPPVRFATASFEGHILNPNE